MRVNEDTVERYLIWARNYGEIASFKRIADAGRKWQIRLFDGVTVTASGAEPGLVEHEVVPDELVFTSREALAFGMGLAVAGNRAETRRETAKREWNW